MSEKIKILLAQTPQADYAYQSRVHPLRSMPRCWVKRDDELGFSISGSKIRKYRTLIPFILAQKVREVAILGGPYSNHVLSITQLLIENDIKPVLYLRGPKPTVKQGNYLFLEMLGPEIRWNGTPSHDSLLIPEAGTLFPSFLGALTLPIDILRNEAELGFAFYHLFLDAGTGWIAAAVLLAFAFWKKTTICHIVLVAGTEESFQEQLAILHARFEEWLGEKCPYPVRFKCHRPSNAPSFGSTNQSLFTFLSDVARQEGFFLDPIYSGKLFFEAKQLPQPGRTLLVHSGGALTLSGFQRFIDNSLRPK